MQYEGETTIREPPLTEAFDPVKRRAQLHPSRTASASQLMQPAPVGSDLGHLSTIITALLGNRAAPEPPKTPDQKAAPVPIQSPAMPTPSKLARFLQHAEKNLGVTNATIYEAALERKGYGPDILHLVKDESLIETGLPPGDVIRMKAGCIAWWSSADAKRKHEPEATATDDRHNHTPPNKKIRYERRYKDGTGANTFWGPVLEPDDSNSEMPADSDLFFFCSARCAMVPVPPGFCVIEDIYDPAQN